MSTILPEGDALRRAIRWISEHRKENPDARLMELINEAVTRFDLSPKDANFLYNFYRKSGEGTDD